MSPLLMVMVTRTIVMSPTGEAVASPQKYRTLPSMRREWRLSELSSMTIEPASTVQTNEVTDWDRPLCSVLSLTSNSHQNVSPEAIAHCVGFIAARLQFNVSEQPPVALAVAVTVTGTALFRVQVPSRQKILCIVNPRVVTTRTRTAVNAAST